MRLCCQLKFFITIFLMLALSYSPVLSQGVELELSGLSPAAKQALQDQIRVREKVRGTIEAPLERLEALQGTYSSTCGNGRPKDSGCQRQFNQIIGSYKKVMEGISEYLGEYNNNIQVVIDELEPQMQRISYKHSPSDLMEDLINKYEGQDMEFEDETANAILEAFVLEEGQTEFEITSQSYLTYKKEYKQYRKIQKLLDRKIQQAEKEKTLGPIINDATKNKLKALTGIIFKPQAKHKRFKTKKRRQFIR